MISRLRLPKLPEGISVEGVKEKAKGLLPKESAPSGNEMQHFAIPQGQGMIHVVTVKTRIDPQSKKVSHVFHVPTVDHLAAFRGDDDDSDDIVSAIQGFCARVEDASDSVAGGVLAVGLAVAVFSNPVTGATIAANALAPKLTSEAVRAGREYLLPKLRSAQKAVGNRIDDAMKDFGSNSVVVNPVLTGIHYTVTQQGYIGFDMEGTDAESMGYETYCATLAAVVDHFPKGYAKNPWFVFLREQATMHIHEPRIVKG